jgi:hypothetical protein
MVVRTLLEAALKKIGVLAPRETANNDELSDCLVVLQSMLRSWAARRLIVYASTEDTKVLTGGTASYSWGTGGSIATTRPNQLLNAFIRESSYDYPVDLISEFQYHEITNKATQGRPSKLWYKPSYPLGYIYLYPTPDSGYTLYVNSLKQFTQTSSFNAITDTLSFPLEYEEAILYGLVERIAPEYGKTLPAEVIGIAMASYDTLININSSNQVEPVSLSFPVGRHGNYNINEG